MLKKLTLLVVFLLSVLPSFSQASVDGWLAGLQFGRYDVDYTAANQGLLTFGTLTLGPARVRNEEGRHSGRVYLGYSINEYLQAELGYTKYSNTQIKNIYGVNAANVTIGLNSYDAVGVVKLPINDVFHAYAKLGASYIQKCSSANRAAKAIPLGDDTVVILPKVSDQKYRAIYGLGVTYDMNQTFAFDIGWSRIDGQGRVKTTDFGYLGIVYYFEQFLT